MADDRFDARDGASRPLGAWTMLFRGFQVALDWKKLVLAAGGIVATAFAWWLLAVIFGPGELPPTWPGDYKTRFAGKELSEPEVEKQAWDAFKRDRHQWNLRYEAAGTYDKPQFRDAGDLAANAQEYERIAPLVARAIEKADRSRRPEPVEEVRKNEKGELESRPYLNVEGRLLVVTRKEAGKLRIWPWFEDRGPNPYLMVTGQAGRADSDGAPRYAPWDRGHFFDWFTTKQFPVLIEPVVKFAQPVLYLLTPEAGFRNRLYFLCVTVATLAVWALFGGAITRMAAVQLARKEKIGLGEAFRFAKGQWKSYLFASAAPLLLVAVVAICLILFGVVSRIPLIGDVLAGILFPLVVIAGVVMAAVLVGYLVGWPLIHATISTEGSDSFDALSRTYSYVFQSPWNYLGYAAVAMAYGAVVVFFVGFMGSLAVYLGKWGLSQVPWGDSSYLYVYAPSSFGWRELLLQGATVDGSPVVRDGEIQPVAYENYVRTLGWYNVPSVFLVTLWVWVLFLLVIGFGYSYFWSASTVIYLLMRHKVDDTELDEVYLEEEEMEDVYTPPPPMDTAPKPGTTPLAVVEPPAAKPVAAPPAPAAPVPTTDGNAGVTG